MTVLFGVSNGMIAKMLQGDVATHRNNALLRRLSVRKHSAIDL